MSQNYQFVAAHACSYPVSVLCRVLGLARSGYYAWRHRQPSAHAQRDHALTQQIGTIFAASRQTYGSPRVHAELRAQDVRCSRKRVARLMRHAQLRAPPAADGPHHQQPPRPASRAKPTPTHVCSRRA